VKKFAYILPAALFVLAAAMPLQAQSGCTDSPENPTAVLGAIVSVASIGFVQIRNRIRARKGPDNK
jgi:XrtJ-associated TM-motif-TM protein